jgi:hypothetical protein
MANLYGRDALGADSYLSATGSGTNADPFVVAHDVFCSVQKSAFIAASGNADLIAAVSNKKLRVMAIALTASDACTLKVQSGGSNDKTPPWHIAPSGNFSLASDLGLFDSGTGEKLNVVLDGTANYTAFVSYREV